MNYTVEKIKEMVRAMPELYERRLKADIEQHEAACIVAAHHRELYQAVMNCEQILPSSFMVDGLLVTKTSNNINVSMIETL